MALSLSRPSLRRQDFDHVLDAMVHDKLSGGEINRQLSKDLARALGLKDVAVTASAGDAIGHLFRGLGLVPGNTVLLSPLAPPYWVPALERAGLIPRFVDVSTDSPVIDVEGARGAVEGAQAILADCCLGYLPDVDALALLGVPIIEDISHGLGGKLNGQAAGTRSQAVLALFAPETLVAGAGGCLVGLRSAALDIPSWELLSDLGSALVASQWRDAATFAEKKREHFRHLFHRLPKSYRQPKQLGDGETVPPWFPVLVDSGAKEVLAFARKKAVEADWAFRHQPYLNAETTSDFCPRARSFLFRTLVFPLYSTFSLKEIELLGKVISALP